MTTSILPLFPEEDLPPSKWNALFSSKSDDWPTERAVVDEWARRVGPFGLDAAADKHNTKAPRFFSEERDALKNGWLEELGGGAVWCNPPYSQVEAFVAKALSESARGCTVVMLLPSRTDTRWFHMVLAAQDRCTIYFARGRLRFGDAKSSAPFPSLVVVMRPPPGRAAE